MSKVMSTFWLNGGELTPALWAAKDRTLAGERLDQSILAALAGAAGVALRAQLLALTGASSGDLAVALGFLQRRGLVDEPMATVWRLTAQGWATIAPTTPEPAPGAEGRALPEAWRELESMSVDDWARQSPVRHRALCLRLGFSPARSLLGRGVDKEAA